MGRHTTYDGGGGEVVEVEQGDPCVVVAIKIIYTMITLGRTDDYVLRRLLFFKS